MPTINQKGGESSQRNFMIPYSKYLNQEIENIKKTPVKLLYPMTVKFIHLIYLVLWYTIRLTVLWVVWILLIITGPVSLSLLAWFAYQKQYPAKGK